MLYVELFCWNAIIGHLMCHHVKFILHGTHLPIISTGARCLMSMCDYCGYGNTVKLQSDWCRSVQNAGITPCIACHQTLPPPPPPPPPRLRVWLHDTRQSIGGGLLLLLLVCVPVSSLVPRPHLQNEGKGSGELGLNPQFSVYGARK